jgi:hypothetical protein
MLELAGIFILHPSNEGSTFIWQPSREVGVKP